MNTSLSLIVGAIYAIVVVMFFLQLTLLRIGSAVRDVAEELRRIRQEVERARRFPPPEPST